MPYQRPWQTVGLSSEFEKVARSLSYLLLSFMIWRYSWSPSTQICGKKKSHWVTPKKYNFITFAISIYYFFRNYNQKKGYYWPTGQLIGQKIPPFFDRRNCRPQARLNKDWSRSITGIAIILIFFLPFLVTFSTGTRWSQRKPISFR